MNCWRNAGKDIHRETFVHRPSQTHVKNVPPKCIGGRWGAATECEKRLLAVDRDVFREAWNTVAMQKAAKRTGRMGE
eukprot:7794071-Pyramimonas_sp.AAC.1